MLTLFFFLFFGYFGVQGSKGSPTGGELYNSITTSNKIPKHSNITIIKETTKPITWDPTTKTS